MSTAGFPEVRASISASRAPAVTPVYNVKAKRIVEVPVDPQFNGGAGVGYYLSKRDVLSGKPLFLPVEAVKGWTDADQAKAADFTPDPAAQKSAAEKQLLAMFEGMSPEGREAIAASLIGKVPAKRGA